MCVISNDLGCDAQNYRKHVIVSYQPGTFAGVFHDCAKPFELFISSVRLFFHTGQSKELVTSSVATRVMCGSDFTTNLLLSLSVEEF